MRLTIKQVDVRNLNKFRDIFDMGKVYGPYVENEKRSPIHYYRLSGWKNVQLVVCFMWPWLSPAKREQYIKYSLKAKATWMTVCKNGHDLSNPENVYRRKDKPYWRVCKTCLVDGNKRWREKVKPR